MWIVANEASLFFFLASIGQRRFQSTSTTFLTKRHEASFRKTWLSDPSTYPLIVVMGVAAALVTGVGGSCLLYNPEYVVPLFDLALM